MPEPGRELHRTVRLTATCRSRPAIPAMTPARDRATWNGRAGIPAWAVGQPAAGVGRPAARSWAVRRRPACRGARVLADNRRSAAPVARPPAVAAMPAVTGLCKLRASCPTSSVAERRPGRRPVTDRQGLRGRARGPQSWRCWPVLDDPGRPAPGRGTGLPRMVRHRIGGGGLGRPARCGGCWPGRAWAWPSWTAPGTLGSDAPDARPLCSPGATPPGPSLRAGRVRSNVEGLGRQGRVPRAAS